MMERLIKAGVQVVVLLIIMFVIALLAKGVQAVINL